MRNSNFRFIAALTVMFSICVSAFGQGKGFDTSRMDTSVDACTDFFEYANGTWLKNTQIPATESRWGTFNILGDNNDAILKDVLETASKTKSAAGSDSQLIGDYYASCMDEAAIEKADAKPLKSYFKQIDKIKTAADLQNQIAMMHNAGFPAVFGFGGGPDLKNSSMVIVNARQGGLSLPNRDYYTKDDEKTVETRQKFMEYMTTMFKNLGDDAAQAQAHAKTVMDIQTRLAKSSLGQVELRNPDNSYNKMTITAAEAITPDISWTNYMKMRGIPAVSEMNFSHPNFFKEVNAMMKDVSLDDWKTYLRFMVVNASANSLSRKFSDANFEFFGKYLSGAKERQPRWKTCVNNTDGTLGEALGAEYVKRTFKPEAKARMNELIDNLLAAMKDRVNGLEWMGAETKAQAQRKLSTFKRKIGSTDNPRGFKGLTIDKKSYAGNVMRSRAFQVRRNVEDINKPVDRTRWGFTPSTVNASYSGVNNDITFPAGILQPPFFNFEADDAINYGAIGGVIGHEISHGFDDSGSRFDADGNLKMWWTSDDRKKFEERAACVVNQFNEYEVQPGLFIDGKLTLGENIGDFAGLTVAYEAFKKSMAGKPRPANIDGFTPEQRFFLGWAQVWAGKYTPEAERLQVKTNTHSLPRWRVNGPMSNMPQFKEAFGCKEGQKMVRKDACLIW
ncbi:MAG: M13 family metallopeptidase [Pyrinomonadaceae bacterium]|nr:M13 family metallopeptidase [Pyrinomonadaceae bacterium]